MKLTRILAIGLIGIIVGITLTASWDWTRSGNAKNETGPLDKDEYASLERTSQAFVRIAKAVTPAVVNISTERLAKPTRDSSIPFHWFFDDDSRSFDDTESTPRPNGLGSGVLISKDGYILTNNHVISDSDRLLVKLSDDREFEAKVIGSDEQTDLAVIKIEGKELPSVKLGNSEKLEVGEWVVAIGNPFGLSETVTAGIVSAKGRSALGLAEYEDFIQTDAAINPGNSGGALVNIRGELIGINTAIETRTGGFQGVGFAIPIDMANKIMQQLIDHGEVTRGWLGVQIQNVENDAMMRQFKLKDRKGVIITNIFDGHPAAEAGALQGDVIVKYDGHKVDDVQQLRNLVASTLVGSKIAITVLRNGETKNLTVALAKKPDNPNLLASELPDPADENPTLGIEVQAASAGSKSGVEATSGVVITRVVADSPAEEAGLKAQDIIVEIDRKKISVMPDYHAAVKNIEPGSSVLLLVQRGDNTRFVVLNVPNG